MNDQRRLQWRPALAAAAWALVASQANAQSPIAPAAAPIAASTCVPCHGPTGQARLAGGVPRLAGLNAKYLEAQLLGYRNGRRRSEVMEPVVKQLEPADIAALATFFASQPVVEGLVTAVAAGAGASSAAPASAAEAATTAAATTSTAAAVDGAALARRGNWKNGVPACAQCHAPDGLGVGDSFPPIAGQPAVYLAGQLLAWQARERDTDPLGLMQAVASGLSAAEIDAVAAWYAALPSTAAPAIAGETAKPLKPSKANRATTRRRAKP